MPWLLYHRERDPVHTALEVGWARGTSAQNPTPIRIWSPDHPAPSRSLYQPWYSSPLRVGISNSQQKHYWMAINHICMIEMKERDSINRMTLYSSTLIPKFITSGQLTHSPADLKWYRYHTWKPVFKIILSCFHTVKKFMAWFLTN